MTLQSFGQLQPKTECIQKCTRTKNRICFRALTHNVSERIGWVGHNQDSSVSRVTLKKRNNLLVYTRVGPQEAESSPLVLGVSRLTGFLVFTRSYHDDIGGSQIFVVTRQNFRRRT